MSISYDDNHYTAGGSYPFAEMQSMYSTALADWAMVCWRLVGWLDLLYANPCSFIKINKPDIGRMVRVLANGPGEMGSIPGRVIPKTQKMVLDASLLNTQDYKVRIKGKVEQSSEGSSALPYTFV